MNTKTKQLGFSLLEVIIAVGILTVGMLMVAGTFPVGIYLTSIATERTIGAAAADEAFAKVRIYGDDTDMKLPVSIVLSDTEKHFDYNDIYHSYTVGNKDISLDEFDYPSVADTAVDKLYFWSAIYRFSDAYDPTQAQVTVFVSRRIAAGLNYYEPEDDLTDMTNYGKPIDNDFDSPKPVKLKIQSIDSSNRGIELDNAFLFTSTGFTDYITDESVIVDDKTGEIYRVIEIDADNDKFIIDKDWQSGSDYFWVVPPPVGGGRSPCVGVYQRTMNF